MGNLRSRRLYCAPALFVAAFSLFVPHWSLAVSNFCPSGTCDIATPTYINVYWDTGNWDTDVQASSPDMTMARIDALTHSLIASAYFSGLQQYGVTSVAFASSSIMETNCGPPPSDLDTAHPQLGDFATCVVNEHSALNNGNTILNVLIPPQSVPTAGSDFCGKFNGEHDKYGSPVEVTFLPTNQACNSSVSALLNTMSHEMVEAATDPIPKSPTGWKVFAGDEVADQCQGQKAPGADFLFGTVQSYFSDSANACTTGFSTVPPTITTSSVCGTGQDMVFELQGKFGQTPWDLVSPGVYGAFTVYLSAAISANGTLANILGSPRTPHLSEGSYGRRARTADWTQFGSVALLPATGNPSGLLRVIR